MIERKIIKVRTDMFEDTKFKLIDRMKERNLINYIWFRIMTLAGKVNKGGDLYFSTTKPYTVETLAVEFNREESEIELALGVLVDLEIMEVTENYLYRVKNFAKHQGIKSKEKIEKNSHIVKDEKSVRNKEGENDSLLKSKKEDEKGLVTNKEKKENAIEYKDSNREVKDEKNKIKEESKTNIKVNDIDVFENKNELKSENKEIRNDLDTIHEKNKEINDKALIKEKKYNEIKKEDEVIPLLVDVGKKGRKKNKKIEKIETIGDIKEEQVEMCGFIDDISSLGTPIMSWSF